MTQDLSLVGDGDLDRPNLVRAEAGGVAADRLDRGDLDRLTGRYLDGPELTSRHRGALGGRGRGLLGGGGGRCRLVSTSRRRGVLAPFTAATSGDDQGKDPH